MEKNDIGLIGLAVMGQNLVMNLADHGYKTAFFNRSREKTDLFINESKTACESTENLDPYFDIKSFVESIERPRRILLMVKAGDGVDAVIESLLPHLEKGDLIADLGNSFFRDSIRREESLAGQGILFAGVGVSGGEEGARRGPSIMPGGSPEAAALLESVLTSISAEVKEIDGSPAKCCRWLGGGGSGHYVKMVHNGIEYGDMQIISEAYNLMTAEKNNSPFHLTNDQASKVFTDWNNSSLAGFLNEITSEILQYRDEDGSFLIDSILDAAGQKGTGKWTVEESFNQGRPVTVISEAVYARALSSLKSQRIEAKKHLQGSTIAINFSKKDNESIISDLGDALLASRIISYAQGFSLMTAASDNFRWELSPVSIAEIWRGGCIIRSALLSPIRAAFTNNSKLPSLLFDEYFSNLMTQLQSGWRRTAARGIAWGIPLPGITSALSYFDGFRSGRLPANLIQAQRDYFGGHMYERTDKPRGEFFHTNWTGRGGKAASSAYNA
ncbi:MAG: decarboxylating NADP(+)-dependent phosphogluconate dehydrogenase [Spirochaetales bacterium]|nr:decarboxylating NADP(+)-dependent phosphogluconate dehydrogenase [Spirochaetales bacterium]